MKIALSCTRELNFQGSKGFNIDQKSIKKSIKNYSFHDRFFYRCFINFWTILASKIRSKSTKNLSKNNLKNYMFLYRFLIASGSNFGGFGLQIRGPRWTHEGPANRLFEVLLALGAKMAPRPPQEAPRPPKT